MSEALAGAIGLGLNNIGAAIANHSQQYGALNQIALAHGLNAQAAQQAHEHRLTELGVAQGFTASENALTRAHTSAESLLNRKHELAKSRQEGRNKVNELNAGHANSLNATQFAINQAKKGNIMPGTAVKIHQHGVDFTTPTGPVVKKPKKKMPKPSRGGY